MPSPRTAARLAQRVPPIRGQVPPGPLAATVAIVPPAKSPAAKMPCPRLPVKRTCWRRPRGVYGHQWNRADVIILAAGWSDWRSPPPDSRRLSAIFGRSSPTRHGGGFFGGRTARRRRRTTRSRQARCGCSTRSASATPANARCPIQTIAVADGLDPGGFILRPNRGTRSVMHENRHLRRPALARRTGPQSVAAVEIARGVDRSRRTWRTVALEDGRRLSARAADRRRRSQLALREEAGIRLARWKSDHQANRLVLRHERPMPCRL